MEIECDRKFGVTEKKGFDDTCTDELRAPDGQLRRAATTVDVATPATAGIGCDQECYFCSRGGVGQERVGG